MLKLFSIIAEWLARRSIGRRKESEDEDQNEPLDLSVYGTPVEDWPCISAIDPTAKASLPREKTVDAQAEQVMVKD